MTFVLINALFVLVGLGVVVLALAALHPEEKGKLR